MTPSPEVAAVLRKAAELCECGGRMIAGSTPPICTADVARYEALYGELPVAALRAAAGEARGT